MSCVRALFVLEKTQIGLYSETITGKHKLALKCYLSLLNGKAVLTTAPATKALSFYENILKSEVSTRSC